MDRIDYQIAKVKTLLPTLPAKRRLRLNALAEIAPDAALVATAYDGGYFTFQERDVLVWYINKWSTTQIEVRIATLSLIRQYEKGQLQRLPFWKRWFRN